MSHLLKGKPKPRDPPPALFNHPSRTASHASLPGPGAASGGSNAPLQPSTTSAFTSPTSLTSLASTGAGGGSGPSQTSHHPASTSRLAPASGGLNINISSMPIPSLRSRESTRATDRTDALWAEMQATLEAVELSAGGGAGTGGAGAGTGTVGASAGSSARVFHPDHERKLDELRAAQIALAQAWARSEADEAIETTAAGGGGGQGGSGMGVGEGGVGGAGMSEGRSVVTDAVGGIGAGGKSTVGTGSARPGSSGLGMGIGAGGQERSAGSQMEEETGADILLARKRREANDRYFQRVNQGVLDVVAKLEEVAIAMREVEQESKELWGDDNESVPGSAKT